MFFFSIRCVFAIINNVCPQLSIQFFQIFLVVIASLCIDSMLIFLLSPAIDFLINGKDFYIFEAIQEIFLSDSDFIIVLLFCLLVFFSAFLKFLVITLQSMYARDVSNSIAKGVVEQFLNRPYESQRNLAFDEFISDVSLRVNSVTFSSILPTLSFFVSSTLVVGYVVIGFLVDPLISILGAACLTCFYITITLLVRARIKAYGNILDRQQVAGMMWLERVFYSAHEIRMAAAENSTLSNYGLADKTARTQRAKINIVGSIPRVLIEAVAVLVLLFGIFIGKNFTDVSELLGLVLTFGLLAQRSLPHVQQCYSSWATISGDHSQLDKLRTSLNNDRFDGISSVTIAPSPNKDLVLRLARGASIALDDGNFLTLTSDISLETGQLIAIKGKSGSGKSMFVETLVGLRKLHHGVIEISTSTGSKRDLLDQSWIVGSDSFFFEGTLAANVIYPEHAGLDDDAQQLEKVLGALNRAHFSRNNDHISFTDLGFFVSADGSNLSRGQRQRVALARCIYHSRQILVLDEATSAIPVNQETEIIEGLRISLPDSVILFISHRENLNLQTDKEIIVKDGLIQ